MSAHALPAEFADLEPFVAEWALPTERERQVHRARCGLNEARAFYDALLPRMPAVFDYFDTIPHGDLAKLSEEQHLLYQLAASFYEAAQPIEMGWQRTDIDDAFPLERLGFLPPSSQR